uniref:Uncharacterized protein n=1 Tax=Varanus komodoensis TaxID=61221 RepID=A0A8D2IR32_VARKO
MSFFPKSLLLLDALVSVASVARQAGEGEALSQGAWGPCTPEPQTPGLAWSEQAVGQPPQQRRCRLPRSTRSAFQGSPTERALRQFGLEAGGSRILTGIPPASA